MFLLFSGIRLIRWGNRGSIEFSQDERIFRYELVPLQSNSFRSRFSLTRNKGTDEAVYAFALAVSE
jgi:hypothetical protein